MADFNLELSFKVIPEFNGKYEGLQSFLKIVEIIDNSLKTKAMQPLIDFIINVKLSYTVRTSISTSECKTFEDLKNLLTASYKTKRNIPQIQNSLSRYEQRNDTVRVYSEKILKLIDEINELQIQELSLTTDTKNKTLEI